MKSHCSELIRFSRLGGDTFKVVTKVECLVPCDPSKNCQFLGIPFWRYKAGNNKTNLFYCTLMEGETVMINVHCVIIKDSMYQGAYVASSQSAGHL